MTCIIIFVYWNEAMIFSWLMICTLAAQPKEFVLGAGGDIAFGRYLKSGLYRPHGGETPFSDLKRLFSQADLVFANLETPLQNVDPPHVHPPKNSLTFRADLQYAQHMKTAGLDLLSLANNHMEDCTLTGISHTQDALSAAGIHYGGANMQKDPYEPVIFEHQGTEIVFFARSTKRNHGSISRHPYIAFERAKDIHATAPQIIQKYKKIYPSALFIFSLHWGAEYSSFPVSIQRSIAHVLIDSGVHAVLGHHPHVLQPVETYKDGVILYSMGNLLFDQFRSETQKGAFFYLHFAYQKDWSLNKIRIVPLKVLPPPNTTEISKDTNTLMKFEHNSTKKRYSTTFQWKGEELLWFKTP